MNDTEALQPFLIRITDAVAQVRTRFPMMEGVHGQQALDAYRYTLAVLFRCEQHQMSLAQATDALTNYQLRVAALAERVCQALPYRGCLPELTAFGIAAVLLAGEYCIEGSHEGRFTMPVSSLAHIALQLGPLREAFVAALQDPTDQRAAYDADRLFQATYANYQAGTFIPHR